MTIEKHLKTLESRYRLLTAAELAALTDAALDAYTRRLDTWNGNTTFFDFRARLEAMPDDELRSLYQPSEGSR